MSTIWALLATVSMMQLRIQSATSRCATALLSHRRASTCVHGRRSHADRSKQTDACKRGNMRSRGISSGWARVRTHFSMIQCNARAMAPLYVAWVARQHCNGFLTDALPTSWSKSRHRQRFMNPRVPSLELKAPGPDLDPDQTQAYNRTIMGHQRSSCDHHVSVARRTGGRMAGPADPPDLSSGR